MGKKWFEKKLTIYIILFISVLITSSILLIKNPNNYLLHIIFGIMSMLSYFVGILMGYFVIGIQAINPLCPVKIFDFFSKVFFYLFLIGGVIITIIMPIIALIIPSDEIVLFNSAPTCYGCILAINKIRIKFYETGRGASSSN